jgi:predicted DNA-binding transcriptional regulator AlpA
MNERQYEKPKITADKNLLTPAKVAEILGIKVSLLTNWRHNKKGPSYFKIGKQIRYDKKAIDAFLKNGFVDIKDIEG